ncbi:MAG: hypothetical protein ACXV5U_03015 [Ilumatobacteraceae bacterium]
MAAKIERAVPCAVAGGLAVVAIVLRWRGSDLPAQFFRVGLVERYGFGVWNNYWFAGHHTVGYGVLFPVLGAAVGIWTVAVASAALSALLADLVIRKAIGHTSWMASLWFAVGTVTNVAVGRLPFALGMTIGLAALLAAQHRRIVLSLLIAAATGAASAVVSVFLVVIFAAWAVVSTGRDRRFFGAAAAAAIVPVLLISVVYPQGGMFPFRWGALVWTLIVCAAVATMVPVDQKLLRVAAGFYGLASVAAFVVPTPLGANITRLGMYAAAPVLLAVAQPRRIAVSAAIALIAFWQWSPAFDAIVRAGRDPSTNAAYYQPVLAFLAAAHTQPARVEVVPTKRHWEATFVALDVPIARGWERQFDTRYNPQFYKPGLTADGYRRWLLDWGVRYVALSDAPVDRSGQQEAALLTDGLPFLRPIFANNHWKVWEVIDGDGLVEGPAQVVALGIDSITLRVLSRGDVIVRIHGSSAWATDPPTCIETTSDGWIILRDAQPGPLRVFLDETAFVSDHDHCPPGQ